MTGLRPLVALWCHGRRRRPNGVRGWKCCRRGREPWVTVGPALTWTPSEAPLSNSSGGRAAADFRSTHAACWASDSSSAGDSGRPCSPSGRPPLDHPALAAPSPSLWLAGGALTTNPTSLPASPGAHSLVRSRCGPDAHGGQRWRQQGLLAAGADEGLPRGLMEHVTTLVAVTKLAPPVEGSKQRGCIWR